MLETSWLWFVISKEYVELTRPKIESRDPIFFTGTRSRSRVSGNDRLFPRGSEFGPNLEIPAGPAIQLRPGPVYTSGHCRRWRSRMEVKIMAGSLFVHCKIAYFYSVTAEKWLIVSLPNFVTIRRIHFHIQSSSVAVNYRYRRYKSI